MNLAGTDPSLRRYFNMRRDYPIREHRYDGEKRVLSIGGLIVTASLFAYLASLAIA
jgi:hypothetical protein